MLGIYEEEEIRAVAEKIRKLTEEEGKYSTAEMPEGVGAVYDKGYHNGYAKCTEDMQDALQAKYKAGYNSGLNDGANSVMYSLYGSYVMPSTIVARSIIPYLWTSPGGVMAYFYDGTEYHYGEVSEIEFGQDFSMVIRSAMYSGISYTSSAGWATTEGDSFPDARCRVVTFTQPVEVGFEFYDNWLQVCKSAAETPCEVGYNEGVAAQPTPTISVSTAGLITATAGEKSATKQLTAQGGVTLTPKMSSSVVVPRGRYTTGDVVLMGSVFLQPPYIKQGVSIFGVTGTYDNYAQGMKDGIPIEAQSKGQQVSSQYLDDVYDRTGAIAYTIESFAGTKYYGSAHEGIPYDFGDWIKVTDSGVNSTPYIMTFRNENHTFNFKLYVRANVIYDGVIDEPEYHYAVVDIPPESTTSIEFDADYEAYEYAWNYDIEGVYVDYD